MEPDKMPRNRASKFIKDLVAPAWQPSRDQVLWATRIVLVLAVLLAILTLIGLPFGITLWAWVKLLIVPVVLAIGGYLFTRSENRATRVAAGLRAQDEALQAYLDQIGQLLLDKDRPLRQSEEGDEDRTLARARTLTVLPRLDGDRKARVVQFLYESGLISKEPLLVNLDGADLREANLNVANLHGAVLVEADLGGADLGGADLGGADLRRAVLVEANLIEANLSEAYLMWANLSEANLSRANLRKADLGRAKLNEADLSEAYLDTANLHGAVLSKADLGGAELGGTDLGRANLSEANLSEANLREADLRGAQVADHQLADTQSLQGATMPNGQKHEVWLKDREGRKEDGENG